MRPFFHRRVHLVALLDGHEDQGRLERDRRQRVGGHADRVAVRRPAGEYRDARRKAAEELAELRRLDAA